MIKEKKKVFIKEVKQEEVLIKEKYTEKKKDKLINKYLEFEKTTELLNVLKEKRKQKIF